MTKVNIPLRFRTNTEAWDALYTWCIGNGLIEPFFNKQGTYKGLNPPEIIAQWIQDLKEDLERTQRRLKDVLDVIEVEASEAVLNEWKKELNNEHSN